MRMVRFGLLPALCALPAQAEQPVFRLPIACTPGETCEIQHYVDRDAGPGAGDFMCGTRTYDGHDGTDFRLPSLVEQRTGVDVLAAAEGRVLRVRDGMADIALGGDGGASAVKGRECGNGVVIAHAGGWETQYCHLARASIRVKPGDRVAAGQAIGRVGLSGASEFPHVHFTVREGGHVVDPFAYGAEAGACGGGVPLWASELRPALAYKGGAILNAGFAAGAVTMAQIEAGAAGFSPPTADAPAMVAFARAIGLRAGDVQLLVLTGPDGKVLAGNEEKPLDRDKAQYMLFAGRKRPASGWPRGLYTATYTVRRNGAVLLERTFALKL